MNLKRKIRRLLLRLLSSRHLRPDSEEAPSLVLSSHEALTEAMREAVKHSERHDVPVYVMARRSISAEIRHLERVFAQASAGARPDTTKGEGSYVCASQASIPFGWRPLCCVTYVACWED
jgi:hypothetical protein